MSTAHARHSPSRCARGQPRQLAPNVGTGSGLPFGSFGRDPVERRPGRGAAARPARKASSEGYRCRYPAQYAIATQMRHPSRCTCVRPTCSHAGVVLLAELADRLGLTSELGRRANLGLARPGGSHAHDRGAVLRDLVVLLADGGDCVRDLAGLRDQAGLFGRVCSTPTAWRVVGQVAADPRGMAALWSALARVRERAWALGAAPTGPLTIDLDATLLDAHCDKQGARP